jgi:hypothetical protein
MCAGLVPAGCSQPRSMSFVSQCDGGFDLGGCPSGADSDGVGKQQRDRDHECHRAEGDGGAGSDADRSGEHGPSPAPARHAKGQADQQRHRGGPRSSSWRPSRTARTGPRTPNSSTGTPPAQRRPPGAHASSVTRTGPGNLASQNTCPEPAPVHDYLPAATTEPRFGRRGRAGPLARVGDQRTASGSVPAQRARTGVAWLIHRCRKRLRSPRLGLIAGEDLLHARGLAGPAAARTVAVPAMMGVTSEMPPFLRGSLRGSPHGTPCPIPRAAPGSAAKGSPGPRRPISPAGRPESRHPHARRCAGP